MSAISRLAPENRRLLGEFIERTRDWSRGQRSVINETAAEQVRRKRRAVEDFEFHVRTYFPEYVHDKETGKLLRTPKPFLDAVDYLKEHKYGKLTVRAFRGASKTTTFFVFYASWLIVRHAVGLEPLTNGLFVANTLSDAEEQLARLKSELEDNALLNHDWGPFESPGQWAAGWFVTQQGHSFRALGGGQSARGKVYKSWRINLINIDDFETTKGAANERTVEDKLKEYNGAIRGTMDMDRGRVIVTGHPLADGAFIDKMADREDFKVVDFPAIKYDKNGKELSAWPERYSISELRETRQNLIDAGRYNEWLAEYMLDPQPDGNAFSEDSLANWREVLPLTNYAGVVCYADFALSKDARGSDFKVWMMCGIRVKPKGYYEIDIIDVYCDRRPPSHHAQWSINKFLSLTGAERDKVEFWGERDGPQKRLVEDTYYPMMDAKGLPRFIKLDDPKNGNKKGTKETRIQGIMPLFEEGRVFWNSAERNNPHFAQARSQFMGYKYGMKHQKDDAPDAFEGAVSILRKKARGERRVFTSPANRVKTRGRRRPARGRQR